jgi:3-deoxy-D-manno-octulosonate 8-phosphate phosphatase (KDO 8-P phosphatase)
MKKIESSVLARHYGYPFARAQLDFANAAKDIKILLLDVDGVLTDGSMVFDGGGEANKRFNVLDGFGLKLIQQAGIQPVVVTGSAKDLVETRLRLLGVSRAYYEVKDKLRLVDQLLNVMGLSWSNVASIGDDWPDLPSICLSAISAVPNTAHPELIKHARYVTRNGAGQGCVREFCDLILSARGEYSVYLSEMMDRIEAYKKSSGSLGSQASHLDSVA